MSTMDRIKTLGIAAVSGAMTTTMPSTVNAQAPEPAGSSGAPNIVMILADDLGYGDLGCFNPDSKVPTPNLDRLAEQGIRFTNAYCPDAVCTPSRYALMTGRYALRFRSGRVLANWEPPTIEAGRLTLPGLLKQAGYTTAGFSKWHLGATYTTLNGKPPAGQGKFKSERAGANLDLNVPIRDGPADRGFDHWYGFVCASESLVFEQNRAVAMIDVYEPPAAPGAERLPVIKLADYLPLTTDKTVEFIRRQAPQAKAGKPFFVGFFPYVPHIPLAVSDEFKGKTRGGDYGDYVHELDHYVGKVLDELEQTGLADNTLVLFASDNGSQFEQSGEGHRPNGRLRGKKQLVYEGGVRTPFIARWPGRIKPGTTSTQLICLADVMATCAALTGQSLPDGAAEDSISFLPALLGTDAGAGTAAGTAAGKPMRDFVVNRASDGHLAIRVGDWKYIAAHKDATPALYDLKSDVGEKHNLLDQHPDIAARLKSRLEQVVSAPVSQ